jgi:hypothetical protein
MSDKESTIKLVEEEYRNLHQAVEGLDEEQMARVWFGDWGAKDIIAHVLGWEREMVAAMERMARGERPVPEGIDYSDSDAWNAKFSREFRGISARTVLANWEQTHMNFVRAARALPDDRFGQSDEGKPKTANRMLEANGYGHYREHGAQLREWRQREGI